jgi:hypothetical protein
MTNRLPQFYFVPPSAGDRAIAHSNRLKLDLWHKPADDDGPAATFGDFEIHGSIDLAGDVAPEGLALVRDLLHVFRTAPRAAEGGEAHAS